MIVTAQYATQTGNGSSEQTRKLRPKRILEAKWLEAVEQIGQIVRQDTREIILYRFRPSSPSHGAVAGIAQPVVWDQIVKDFQVADVGVTVASG